MTLHDAIIKKDNGTLIRLEVVPGSRILSVPSGYNQWRQRIEVKLTRNAQKGNANDQLIETLSEFLDMNTSNILIATGAKSRQKSVLVKGGDHNDIVSAFCSAIG
ncbi:MAG: DUF167 domain-containing protein [Methanosarcinaceae archaeon]|nr:DUF167 domain-containing protein [Methanosarcinaceae archaeon]